MVLAFLLAQLAPWADGTPSSYRLVLGAANVDEGLRGYLTKYDCSSADLNPIGSVSKADLALFLKWGATALDLPALADIGAAPPTAELEPTVEGGPPPQTDEQDMGMTYAELGLFGRLRTIARCGPLSMFHALARGVWAETAPAVVAAKVALDRALLNRSYTQVVAPQDGQVTRVEQLQVGSYITAAQPLFTLVAPRMWIDANFKEDQLTYMRVGQHGTAKIDAFPDRSFAVHVESLSPGTGTAFSILPPENATGNWVKVTQRLPVRIAFDDLGTVSGLLHAGLSAKVNIDTEHRRSIGGGAAR
jgi:hypothetical protein